jgi:hypothetical protein
VDYSLVIMAAAMAILIEAEEQLGASLAVALSIFA